MSKCGDGMTEIEKIYEEWLNRKDKTIEIDGHLYYRIVHSECFKLSAIKKEILCVVLSPDMPSGKMFEDENGNHFIFGEYHHIRFIDKVPERYFKSGQCSLNWEETKEIGKYLKVIK